MIIIVIKIIKIPASYLTSSTERADLGFANLIAEIVSKRGYLTILQEGDNAPRS